MKIKAMHIIHIALATILIIVATLPLYSCSGKKEEKRENENSEEIVKK